MKKVILFTMFFATLSFGALAGGPDKPEATVANVEMTTMTFAELKALYGAENVVIEGAELADDASVTIQKQIYPCGDPNFFPCDGALAQARQSVQQQANACCCTLTAGIECCDPSTGTLRAILFIVFPNSPSCN